MTAGERSQYAGLELEPVVHTYGVIHLGARRPEIPILGDDVAVRVAGKAERRRVGQAGRVRETAVAKECAEKEL